MLSLSKLGVAAAAVLFGFYLYMALRGPQGLPHWQSRMREIRQLQLENANLRRDVELLEERVRRLRDSPSDQELVIRERLKLLRPGETTFIIPGPNKGVSGTASKAAPESAPAPSND